jgi:phosphoribosylformylglycinamidine (FGAM) synthase-like enzyme
MALFNEKQSRIIVSFNKDNENRIRKVCTDAGINYEKIGEVTGNELCINNYVKLNLQDLSEKREQFFKNLSAK